MTIEDVASPLALSPPDRSTGDAAPSSPGIYHDVPNMRYHRGPGTSKSDLDRIARSPAHFKVQKDHPRPQTPAMLMGSALHKLVLEPETFPEEYAPDPFPGSQAKAAKEARAELKAQGMELIHTAPVNSAYWDRDDWRRIHDMRDALEDHPIASALLSHGISEPSAYWIDKPTGLLCKCRPDRLDADAHQVCIDIKTTGDASYSQFARSVHRFRYNVSAAFYTDGLIACDINIKHYVFIVVERDPPYGVNCFVLDDRATEHGRILYRRNLATVAECMDADEWPGYPKDIRALELPGYAYYEDIS